MNHASEVAVLDANSGKTLAINKLEEEDTYSRASITAVDNMLYIRTESKIYCISK